MLQSRSAAHALQVLSTGCYSLELLDGLSEQAQEESQDPGIAHRIAAARMRYTIHERSVRGMVHGSEGYRAWCAERKQVCHEVRTALARAIDGASR